MATQTQTVPEFTIFTRVSAIPLVNESLTTVHSTLISNAFTSFPYHLAQNLSKSAYYYSEPIQIRLAPILCRADDIANKSLDAVESRYPTPFKITTQEIRGTAHKTIDERVKTPVYSVAQAIDQKFTPVVDYVELAVNKLHSKNGDQPRPKTPTEGELQYQRAFALSKDLSDQLVTYSTAQLHQLEKQSALLQSAINTAQSISSSASSTLVAAQTKVQNVSDNMLQELHKIQSSTAALPAQVQSSLREVSDGISVSVQELSKVLKSDLPMNEKAGKAVTMVQERVHPLLIAAYNRVQEIVHTITSRGQVVKEKKDRHVNGRSNGNMK